MKSSDGEQNRPDISLMDTPGSLERQPFKTEQNDLNGKRSQRDGDIKGNIGSEQSKQSAPCGQSFFICKKKSQSEINTQSTQTGDDDYKPGERDAIDVLLGSPETADVKDSGHLNGQLKIRYLYFLTLNQYLDIIKKRVKQTNDELGMVAVYSDQPKLAVPETHAHEHGPRPSKDRMPRKNESELLLDPFSRTITMAVPKQDVKRIEELPTDPQIKDGKIILRFELSMAGHSWE
jgi:hypothetical protein